MTAAQALLCCLSLAAAQAQTHAATQRRGQRRKLKAKAWFGKSNNRKRSVPQSQHDGADASEPYLIHDVEATKQTAITHQKFHGLYPCQIGTPCPSYSAAFLASRLQVVDNAVTPNRMKRRNTNMESASYHMMGHRHAYDVWRTVDAFDYAVEHLSMYERMMHASKSGTISASRLVSIAR